MSEMYDSEEMMGDYSHIQDQREFLRDCQLLAAEFGFICCEKGMNLEATLEAMKQHYKLS